MRKFLLGLALAASAVTALVACADHDTVRQPTQPRQGLAVATFAGGCFWCVESDFEKVPGVVEAISGYTGGHTQDPTYREVSSGTTGHRESVEVRYDPQIISYQGLLEAFWRIVDPTDAGGQFADRGEEYSTAIFYHTEAQRVAAEESKAALDASGRYAKPVVTPILPAKPFYVAENYHQDYYSKNPLRYRFYRHNSGRDQFLEKTWGEALSVDYSRYSGAAHYAKPAPEVLQQRLTPLQYQVTQQEGTESPFQNAYWDNKRPGIYVDVVTGEPLFSSIDKYASGTGWPSFTRPLEDELVVRKTDYKLIYPRTEVRSRFGDSHLGHVFEDGPAPTGLRYCINSAALRFVPKENLESEGYGRYLKQFSDTGGPHAGTE